MSKRSRDSLFDGSDDGEEEARPARMQRVDNEQRQTGPDLGPPPLRPLQRFAAPTPKPRRAPAQAPTAAPSRDAMDLTVEEEYIYIRIPGEVVKPILKSSLLDFVKQRGTSIFRAAHKLCLDDKLELRLKDRPDTLAAADKAKILDRYEKVWKKDLSDAKKSIEREVEQAEKIEEMHDWEEDQLMYRDGFVKPKKARLRKANDGVVTFAYLIKLLKETGDV